MHTVYSLGYQASTPEDLKTYVDELGALLVDIRYSPYSRDARWTQKALIELLGNRYLWLQDLGNLNYKRGGPIQLVHPANGAARLRPILEQQSILLLCACRSLETCHRKVAAEYLSQALGASVEHLEGRHFPAGTIPALSLTEPWAFLTIIPAKKIETRSWATQYRGKLAIHAAKTFPRDARWQCHQEPFMSTLIAAGIRSLSDLPLGMVIGTVDLVGCIPTTEVGDISDQERAFGNYDEGRFAWLFENAQALPEPVPARGKLGLWRWEPPQGKEQQWNG